MTARQARSAVNLLERDPCYYRNFGVWWWHVKRELKRLGYTQEQIQALGSFEDESATRYYDGKSEIELDALALNHQYRHSFLCYNAYTSTAPDGTVYALHDQDAE